MRAPRASLSLLVLLALPACGDQEHLVAQSCTSGAVPVVRALARAPGRVTLGDGTRLSDCVSEAMDAADLQSVGATFTDAAARLSPPARTQPDAARRLGYLVGAVERGSGRTSGFQAELLFRMRAFIAAGDLPGGMRAAAERGRRAGRRAG